MNKESMAEMSTYIQYLPAMLWSAQDDPDRLLGRMLRIFEKILTGIDDDIAYEQQPLERTIDQLPLLFDAWQTKPALLDWLAAWLDLSLRADWSEYRKRSMIARIMQIYARPGFKASLADHLFLYAGSRFSPRIAVDGGEALWRVTVKPDGSTYLHPLAFSGLAEVQAPKEEPGKQIVYENKKGAMLLHPTAVAIDNRKECYIVADQGSPLKDSGIWGPTIWRISLTGEFVDWCEGEGVGVMPKPQPIYPRPDNEPQSTESAIKLVKPVAIAVDEKTYRYFVLDDDAATGVATLYQIDLNDRDKFPIKEGTKFNVYTTPLYAPVDMLIDKLGRLIILDSGDSSSASPIQPRLIVLEHDGTKWNETPLVLNKGDEPQVIEPTALAFLDDNSYLITDARRQKVDENEQTPPYSPAVLDRLVGDIIKVTIDYKDNKLTITDKQSMLRGKGILAEKNPLIFPSGIDVAPAPSDLCGPEVYVCDVGVKTGFCRRHETLRLMAEPVSIFRIKLSDKPEITPEITPIRIGNALVCPTKLKIDRSGRLLVTDRGAHYTGKHLGGQKEHDWRAEPYQLGITVHFSNQHFDRNGDNDKGNQDGIQTLHKLVIHDLQDLVATEKPAHTTVWCDLNHPLLKKV